jgi:hypothetical protein
MGSIHSIDGQHCDLAGGVCGVGTGADDDGWAKMTGGV